jgi:5-methylcytosine-specific restriction endonuclease McrA
MEGWKARCAKISEEWKIGNRKTLWEADHVQAVVEGGGLVGLEGFQTLCLRCHRAKTAELAARRAVERKASKLKKE